MGRPAVFFDRDNTLIANDGYLGDANRVTLLDGAARAVGRARRLGFAAVVVSNQSGVARGLFGEDEVHAVNARMDELLADGDVNATIDRHEFCPFHPDAKIEIYRRDTPLRKPAAGMIFRAAEALGLDLSRSWLIGDAARDIEAGRAAGCRTILFQDPRLTASPAAADAANAKPHFVAATLAEAVDIIEQAESIAAQDPDEAEAAGEAAFAPPAAPHVAHRADNAAAIGRNGSQATTVVDPSPPLTQPILFRERPAATPARPATPGLIASAFVAPVGASNGKLAESPNPGNGSKTSATPIPPGERGTEPAVTLNTSAAPEQKNFEHAANAILLQLERMTEQMAAVRLAVSAPPRPATPPAPTATTIRPMHPPVATEPPFSVFKMLGGIIQVLAVAAFAWAFVNHADPSAFQIALLEAIVVELLAIALLVMGR